MAGLAGPAHKLEDRHLGSHRQRCGAAGRSAGRLLQRRDAVSASRSTASRRMRIAFGPHYSWEALVVRGWAFRRPAGPVGSVLGSRRLVPRISALRCGMRSPWRRPSAHCMPQVSKLRRAAATVSHGRESRGAADPRRIPPMIRDALRDGGTPATMRSSLLTTSGDFGFSRSRPPW